MRAYLYAILLACSSLCCTEPPTSPAQQVSSRTTAAATKVDRSLLLGCTPSGPERCLNAIDDNCNGLLEEGCGIQGGVVQIMIAWDKPEADVDLNVIDPNGELVEAGHPTQSGLVKERDCPGRTRSGCGGHNLENVYHPKSKPPEGDYQAIVRLERLGGESPPVSVTFGARLGNMTYARHFEFTDPEERRVIVLHY